MEIELNSDYQLEIKNQFYDSLDEILRYLLEVSLQSHESFRKDIVNYMDKIFVNPFAYPILKTGSKQRTYRHITFKKSYHLIYYVNDNVIYLCDIQHIRRNPKLLKLLDDI
ncbi:MAG: hypothetical protein RLZZ306_1560 [Bacteroidota bacterium]|jgi:hypothetical protein